MTSLFEALRRALGKRSRPQRAAALGRADPADLYEALLQAQGELGEIVVVTERSRVLYRNDAMSGISGYSPEELARLPSLFDLVVPEQQEALRARQRAREGQQDRFETVIRRKDGRLVTVEVAVAPFGPPDERRAVLVARDITDRKTAEAALTRRALYDAVTDLPNRSYLRERLEQAIALARRERAGLALLMLDLDHFKEVNDRLGHAAGDALLAEVGRRLRESVRESDNVGRLGGDEFAMLLPASDAPGAEAAAARVLESFRHPVAFEGRTLVVGTSIGIALFPAHGEDADRLLREADIALYAAKRWRGRYVVRGGVDDGEVADPKAS